MNKSFHKRGASPLIATIVLIAFAVSLGGFVMSLGGFYHDKFKEHQTSCSKMHIRMYYRTDDLACSNFESSNIINFYKINQLIKEPECYTEVSSGETEMCGSNEALFNQTWSPN